VEYGIGCLEQLVKGIGRERLPGIALVDPLITGDDLLEVVTVKVSIQGYAF